MKINANCYALVALATLGTLMPTSDACCDRGCGGQPLRLPQPRFNNNLRQFHQAPSWFKDDFFGQSMWSPLSFDVTPFYESDSALWPEHVRNMGCVNSRGKSPDDVDAVEPAKSERNINNMLDEWEKTQLETFERKRAMERKRFEEKEDLERRRLEETLKQDRETLTKQYQHRRSQNNHKGQEHSHRSREFQRHPENSRIETVDKREPRTRHEHRLTGQHQHQHQPRVTREEHSRNVNRFQQPPVTELASIHLPDYKPNEIAISLKGNEVTIKGHHECNCDESCVVTKFQRTYQIPRNVDLETVEASMNEDRVLKLTGRRSQQTREHVAVPGERRLPVNSNGEFESEKKDPQCSKSNPGILIAKRNPRTGKMYVSKDSFVENRSEVKLVDDDIDDVTIETVEYE
ncbi:hypothetical protein CAPTEDRAFT_210078 [Capitella teleta]|uniref:SHSP domain-containing protein n=1 Tax=Capitella teleta TaxID=283909 RepID=R7TS67_CAPTE|nr:hypothetical protein CAPTEDRAFT_210078 [Capitella teleta]|eukprot:ELT93860.1 hypothetical protein CAPTEDRAFT_210078 [Capitella teleta]